MALLCVWGASARGSGNREHSACGSGDGEHSACGSGDVEG